MLLIKTLLIIGLIVRGGKEKWEKELHFLKMGLGITEQKN